MSRRRTMVGWSSLLLAGAIAGACAGAEVRPDPSPAQPMPDARELESLHAAHRVEGLGRKFTPEQYWEQLLPIVGAGDRFRIEQIGASVEGRPLRRIDFGDGPTRVLLWSQMHGDESTASRALVDLFAFLAVSADDLRTRRIEGALTVTVIPVLNPDGASRFMRHNALGVDINRDARALNTPEARALKTVRDQTGAVWGFNLHDQNVRTRLGATDYSVQISLLAPPPGAGETNEPNQRARQLAAYLATLLEPVVGDRIARYSESFNPRAFGDLMTQWGTGTVLIESGGDPADPEKELLRRANFVALLGALDAITTGAWQRADVSVYERLPPNGRQIVDLVLRGGSIVLPGRAPVRADISINFGDSLGREGGRIAEVGDLAEVEALKTLDLEGMFFLPDADALATDAGLHLRVGDLATGVIARDPDGRTVVWRLEEGRPVLVERR